MPPGDYETEGSFVAGFDCAANSKKNNRASIISESDPLSSASAFCLLLLPAPDLPFRSLAVGQKLSNPNLSSYEPLLSFVATESRIAKRFSSIRRRSRSISRCSSSSVATLSVAFPGFATCDVANFRNTVGIGGVKGSEVA